MSSYCEVCQGLFAVPHWHEGGLLQQDGLCRGERRQGAHVDSRSTPQAMRPVGETSPRAVAANPSGSEEALARQGNRPRAHSASHRMTPQHPSQRSSPRADHRHPSRERGPCACRMAGCEGQCVVSKAGRQAERFTHGTFNSKQRAASARPMRSGSRAASCEGLLPPRRRSRSRDAAVPLSSVRRATPEQRLHEQDAEDHQRGAARGREGLHGEEQGQHHHHHRRATWRPSPSPSTSSAVPEGAAAPQRSSKPEEDSTGYSSDTLHDILDRMRHVVRAQRRHAAAPSPPRSKGRSSGEPEAARRASTERDKGERSSPATHKHSEAAALLRKYPRVQAAVTSMGADQGPEREMSVERQRRTSRGKQRPRARPRASSASAEKDMGEEPWREAIPPPLPPSLSSHPASSSAAPPRRPPRGDGGLTESDFSATNTTTTGTTSTGGAGDVYEDDSHDVYQGGERTGSPSPSSNSCPSASAPRQTASQQQRQQQLCQGNSAADALRWYRQLRLTQHAALRAQEAKLEQLRKGFAELCGAVRDDLHAMEERLDGKIASETSRLLREGESATLPSRSGSLGSVEGAAAAVTAAATTSARHATSQLLRTSPSAPPTPPVVPFDALRHAIHSATPEEKRQLLAALAPELDDLIESRVRAAMHTHAATQQAWLQRENDRLRSDTEASWQRWRARMEEEQRQQAAGGRGAAAVGNAVVAEVFSSHEALEAHLRAVARAVLLEEDHHRYDTAAAAAASFPFGSGSAGAATAALEGRLLSTLEKRLHGMIAAQTARVAEKGRKEEKESRAARAAARAQEQRDERTAAAVHALAEDVARLRREQDRLAHVILHEESKLAKARVPSASTAAKGPGAAPALLLSPEQLATADGIRRDVLQPALDHVKRLMAAHQGVVETLVAQRCQQAEAVAQDHWHVWEQNMAELRSRLGSLRLDVRNAFAELCQNLNVATPGL